jgi:competence protein ComEA
MFMPIDLNAAGKEELMRLQEVSEHAAERVVEHRAQNGRFRSVEELAEVEGFSDRAIERIRDQVTVRPGNMADCHRRWLSRGPA